MGTLLEDQYHVHVSDLISLRIRNVPEKTVDNNRKAHFMFNSIF
jgi:hypothetical protein